MNTIDIELLLWIHISEHRSSNALSEVALIRNCVGVVRDVYMLYLKCINIIQVFVM
jgi:hypothetical protein